ncbi:MAG: hypothetical protein AB7L36_00645 [Sphingomonadaceae bacterium]
MKFLLNLLLGGLGIVRRIGRLLARLFGWMCADWRNGPLVMFAFGLCVHIFIIDPGLRRARDGFAAQLTAEQDAHQKTIDNHQQAARQAEAAQAAEIARVRTADAILNERLADDYETRLADLRARAAALAGRVRAGSPATGPGLSGAAAMPGPLAAPGRAAAAAPDQGLPDGACTAMNIEERLIASEQAAQLDALIDGIVAQARARSIP